MIQHRSVILTLQDLTESRWVPAMAEAGLNTLMLHAVRLPYDIDRLIGFRQSDEGRALCRACDERGIRVEYEMHTASYLVPRILFRRDPGLFRMDAKGVRTPDCNFCLSSGRAWELFDRRARDLVAALPSGTGRYLLFPDDVSEGVCHCPGCARLSPSDQAMVYANRLLRSIRRDQPDARVSYLAYQGTLPPPESETPDDGIFLEFAPIRRCYRHAIDDPGCAINRTHLGALERLLGGLKGLPLHVTEYWLDASRHSGWKRPAEEIPVSTEILRRDIACYAGFGASSIATYAVMCDRDYWECYGEPPVREYGAALRDIP